MAVILVGSRFVQLGTRALAKPRRLETPFERGVHWASSGRTCRRGIGAAVAEMVSAAIVLVNTASASATTGLLLELRISLQDGCARCSCWYE